MAVALQHEATAIGVAHLLGDHLHVAAGGDHERGPRVAQVMEGQLADARRPRGGLEDPAHEVVGIEGPADARGKEVALRRGRPNFLLLAQ